MEHDTPDVENESPDVEHATPSPSDARPPEAVVLPAPRHDMSNAALPPLISQPPQISQPQIDQPRGAGTLPSDAGKPIGPLPQPGTPDTDDRRTWRDGGGIHGHDRPPGIGDPLTGLTPPEAVRHRPAGPAVHAGGRPPSPPRRVLATAATGVVAAVLGAGLALGGAALLGAFDDPEQIAASTPSPPEIVRITEVVAQPQQTQAAAVALKVVPSIVTVEVGTTNGDGQFIALGSGSGVVLSSDGAIATNHHVVTDADRLRVVFQDGRIFSAQVRGTDQLTDLAVLTIEAENLTPIELGSTEDLVIGDPAIAVGNPLGLSGGASLTVGVVSAFGREVQVGPAVRDRLFGMLQTDAPITNGSSGGALVDATGRLIGITTAIGVSEAGAEGIGFAIPVELVVRITDELRERGDVRHAFLGVGLQDYLEEAGTAQVPAGASISSIEPGSSAELFGLEIGDRIVGLDGKVVRTNQDVINTLRLYRVGDPVTLEVVRDGETIPVELELGERPDGI